MYMSYPEVNSSVNTRKITQDYFRNSPPVMEKKLKADFQVITLWKFEPDG